MVNETMPVGAKIIRVLINIACAFALFLFLAPLFLMANYRLEVAKYERQWRETIERENAKTEKAVKAWRDAVERARMK